MTNSLLAFWKYLVPHFKQWLATFFLYSSAWFKMTQRLLGYLTLYFKEEQIDAFVTKSSIKCVQECQSSWLYLWHYGALQELQSTILGTKLLFLNKIMKKRFEMCLSCVSKLLIFCLHQIFLCFLLSGIFLEVYNGTCNYINTFWGLYM